MSELKKEIVTLNEDNKLKEGQIQRFVRRIQELHERMHYRSSKVLIAEQGRNVFLNMFFNELKLVTFIKNGFS
jgi:hypothetical protein